MLKVSSLVEIFQIAAQQASASVAAEQLNLLKKYFKNNSGGPVTLSNSETLEPILVKMAFPRETANGPQSHTVYIPLITMVPHSALHMSELELEMDLVAVATDDDVTLAFADTNQDVSAAATQPKLKLRMTFKEGGHPDGVRLILDGYAKALRAQIPN